MSANKVTDAGRRRLLGGTLALGGAALGSGLLPAAAVAGSTQQHKTAQPAPLFDPTLENWPGYSAHIAVPPSLSAAAADEDGLGRL